VTLTTPAVPDPTMRWGIRFTPYPWTQCRFCGRATEPRQPDCRPGVCPACGSRQCNSRQGRCVVCLVGIMPDWSGWQRECGYAGCHEQAVARAPRVGQVCAAHLERPKRWWGGKQISVADDIAERLAVRDRQAPARYSYQRFVLIPEVTG
jgi:hypothetical protein